ncbi:MAG: ATP-binding protein [Alphaproteobacteria bacterium]|nr:ATP-binding protein [Alphaproteobacteria bacterium]
MAKVTYRTTLLVTVVVLLALTLFGAGLSYWGAERSRYHLERSQLAHQVLEGHLRLSSETYQLFKQLADVILIGDADNRLNEQISRSRLEATLNKLRDLIASEVAYVDTPEELSDEKDELARLALIERQIAQVLSEFAEVRSLVEQGRERDAWILLSGVLDQSIDKGFNSLIDQSIAGELAEVEEADRDASQLLHLLGVLAEMTAIVAVLFAVAGLAVLLRRLRRPIENLVQGTEALAAGNLQHRIAVDGYDEFATLAHSFNEMAGDLERNQRDLRHARDGLEQTVTERTKELKTANQRLHELDKTRRRFIADISHELRTPLTVIRGEAEIALRGETKPSKEYRATLQRVVDQAAHTSRLVEDLLFVARSEAGGARLKLEPVALGELVQHVCEDMVVLAARAQVELEVRDAADQITVSGDRGRLMQLLIILLENAIRYSKPGGNIVVDVLPGPGAAVVHVRDQGVGIPPDEVERVFDRFYRGCNAVRQNAEGSGLGLPVAKAIVEAHNGDIHIASVLEEGTKVTVMLPIVGRLKAIA